MIALEHTHNMCGGMRSHCLGWVMSTGTERMAPAQHSSSCLKTYLILIHFHYHILSSKLHLCSTIAESSLFLTTYDFHYFSCQLLKNRFSHLLLEAHPRLNVSFRTASFTISMSSSVLPSFFTAAILQQSLY
jgi:hypothetical protein